VAHQIVQCAHRQQPSPTVELVVGGYKYPTTTTTSTIQAFTTPHSIQEQYTTLQDTNQSLRSNQSPQSTLVFRTCEKIDLCSFVAWLAFFFLSFLLSKPCKHSKRHQLCGGPCEGLSDRLRAPRGGVNS
jgi:hypothetical protein